MNIDELIEEVEHKIRNILHDKIVPTKIVDKNGKIQLLDIKTISYRKRAKGKILKNKPKGSYKIHRTATKEQKRLGIRLLMINYED